MGTSIVLCTVNVATQSQFCVAAMLSWQLSTFTNNVFCFP